MDKQPELFRKKMLDRMSLIEKYTDDDGAEISVYAIERMKNE